MSLRSVISNTEIQASDDYRPLATKYPEGMEV